MKDRTPKRKDIQGPGRVGGRSFEFRMWGFKEWGLEPCFVELKVHGWWEVPNCNHRNSRNSSNSGTMGNNWNKSEL